MENVIVTGLYRSGTTYVERALGAQTGIPFVYQPVPKFFKALNTKLLTVLGVRNPSATPLGVTRFWDELSPEILEHTIFSSSEMFAILDAELAASERSTQEPGNLSPSPAFYRLLLSKLRGDTSAGHFLRTLTQAITEYRGFGGDTRSGFKEVFLGGMIPFIAASTEAKIILLVRDPREIVFSRNHLENALDYGTSERHPIRLITSMWNTLIDTKEFIVAHGFDAKIVAYESLGRPNFLAEIAEFIGVPSVNQEELLRTESGHGWSGNSSGADGRAGFGSRWREAMPVEEVALIEDHCGTRMDMEGFNRSLSPSHAAALSATFQEDTHSLVPWTRQTVYVQNTE